MNKLAQRLKELRSAKKITQKEFSEILDLSMRGYQNYETAQREPKIDQLIQIADFFDVSLDYLVGRSDKKN